MILSEWYLIPPHNGVFNSKPYYSVYGTLHRFKNNRPYMEDVEINIIELNLPKRYAITDHNKKIRLGEPCYGVETLLKIYRTLDLLHEYIAKQRVLSGKKIGG